VYDRLLNVPVLAVTPPIAGGEDKSKVPPSVRFPLVVTVPVKVRPLTVPVPPTLVTVPTLDVFELAVANAELA
jgi:hypothetical protein